MNEDEASYEETHGPQVNAEFVHFDEEAADPPISSTSRDAPHEQWATVKRSY